MNRFYKILPWIFGSLCTIVLIGDAAFEIKRFLVERGLLIKGDLPKEISFNKNSIDIALETVKILLPINCGYILFVAPTIKYLKAVNLLWNKEIIIGILLTFSFGIVAIGLWTGVLAFIGNAAHGIDFKAIDNTEYNFNFFCIFRFASLAHLFFFTSIAWFITTVIITLNTERIKNN